MPRSTADAIEGSGWGGPLANGVRGGAAGGQPPLPPLTPLRATNSGIPHYDIPGGKDHVHNLLALSAFVPQRALHSWKTPRMTDHELGWFCVRHSHGRLLQCTAERGQILHVHTTERTLLLRLQIPATQ